MHALILLLDAIAGFFTLIFLARFFMQLHRVSFTGQLGGFVVQLSNWAIKPLRRIIPGWYGVDLASPLAAWLLQCLLLAAIFLLRGVDVPDLGTLIFLLCWQGLMATLRVAIWLFIGALLMQAVLSWVNPHSPLTAPITQLTAPLLRPLQRRLPPISGIDLSPLVLIVLLQVLLALL